jgi:hypothetical protein
MSFRKISSAEKQKFAGKWPIFPGESDHDFEYVVIEPFTVSYTARAPGGGRCRVSLTVPTGFLSDGVSLANRYFDFEKYDMDNAWVWMAHDYLYECHELDGHPNAGGEAGAAYLADQVFLAPRTFTSWVAYLVLRANARFNFSDNYRGRCKFSRIPLHPIASVDLSEDEIKRLLRAESSEKEWFKPQKIQSEASHASFETSEYYDVLTHGRED